MATKKTLGGERLGSGNKMKVDLHGFERSTHDLGYLWRSTMSAGTLVPFLCEVALPGDTFDINLNCDIKTHPTRGPLFGSYKVQLDVFSVPMRLYHSALHNNRLGIGLKMSQIKLPKFVLPPTYVDDSGDIDNESISPSCLLSYLGVRGVGTVNIGTGGTALRKFNGIPLLAFWDIYKNYYSNKQEEIGYVIHATMPVKTVTNIQGQNAGANIPIYPLTSPGVAFDSGADFMDIFYTGAKPTTEDIEVYTLGGWYPIDSFVTGWDDTTAGRLRGYYNFNEWDARILDSWRYKIADNGTRKPNLVSFPLENIDIMRDKILQKAYNAEFEIASTGLEPYVYVLSGWTENNRHYNYARFNQEGLAVKTYQSDLFNNWLSSEWLDGTGGINEITAVDTSSGSFNIDALNLSKKVYDMLNRIAVSGGTYDDWLEAVYDHESYTRAETPVYMGGLIKELTFQEVINNSASEVSGEGVQALGTLAGRGVMGHKHKGGTVIVKTNEPSYIIGIISLTPRIDYSQGNKWDVNLDTLDDLHKPSLDQIGFQELITDQMAWWSTADDGNFGFEFQSAGKQPAWINYMTNVNQIRGNFAIEANEMFMVLNRRYTPEKVGVGRYQIKDLTTYIDPSLFNHIFAQTSLDAQNFWAQISVDMIARRKMSAKVMPNL